MTEFLSISHGGMALDILTGGKRDRGIIELLSALFGIDPDSQLISDGSSLKTTVEQIYNQGRSQFSHGGRPALLEHVPISRAVVDQVCARAFECYAIQLAGYNGPDNYESFLAYLESSS